MAHIGDNILAAAQSLPNTCNNRAFRNAVRGLFRIKNIFIQSQVVKNIGEKSRNVWININLIFCLPIDNAFDSEVKYLTLLNLYLSKQCGFFLQQRYSFVFR